MITHCDPSELPEAASEDRPQDHMLEAFCPACAHVVDACCPKCRTHVEPGGCSEVAAKSVLSSAEVYRRFILMAKSASNTKFFFECFLLATGDAEADGVSMNDLAKAWSVKKATVSKQCVYICSYLGIPPSRYMRSVETKQSYRQSNVRPQKIQ